MQKEKEPSVPKKCSRSAAGRTEAAQQVAEREIFADWDERQTAGFQRWLRAEQLSPCRAAVSRAVAERTRRRIGRLLSPGVTSGFLRVAPLSTRQLCVSALEKFCEKLVKFRKNTV